MPRFYRLFNVCHPTSLPQKLLLFSIFLLWLLWFAGCFDFLRETDYQQFNWSPLGNVKHQVARELIGLPPKIPLINEWEDFPTLAQPTCKNNWLTNKRSILIVVKSAPDRIARRLAFRKTISKVRQLGGYRIRTVFIMGRKDEFEGSSLQDESSVHEDMLVGDFVDHYFNNTHKYMHSLKLARWHCPSNNSFIPFLLLLDDDYILRLDNLIKLLRKHQPNEQLYMGSLHVSKPFRLAFRKFRVSIDEYPFNKFPPYISGGAVLYSARAVKDFYLAAQHLRLLRFDDVYAGIIAYYLSYDVQRNTDFVSYRNGSTPWTTKIAEHGYSAKQILNAFSITNSTFIR